MSERYVNQLVADDFLKEQNPMLFVAKISEWKITNTDRLWFAARSQLSWDFIPVSDKVNETLVF